MFLLLKTHTDPVIALGSKQQFQGKYRSILFSFLLREGKKGAFFKKRENIQYTFVVVKNEMAVFFSFLSIIKIDMLIFLQKRH